MNHQPSPDKPPSANEQSIIERTPAPPIDETQQPNATAAGFTDLCDGALKPLDPRYVQAETLSWWITTGIVSGGGALALIVFAAVNSPSTTAISLLIGGWIVLTGLLIWGALAWPGLVYRRTRYAVSPLGLEIHRGVIWRHVINLPQSRVQHTDVTQGPVMRRFGISTLVVHTAGTLHASVALQGLTHEIALRIRNFLIAEQQGGGASDAV